MTRPAPWNVADRPTVFLSELTAQGVDDGGRPVRAVIGGRRTHPQLADLLETALRHGAQRVFLVGPSPTKPARPVRDALGNKWLLRATPGWTPGTHYLHSTLPVGRFTHDATGAKVQLRRAAEWFGEGDYSATDARTAWSLTLHVHRRVFGERAGLHDSPAATGLDAWARSLPHDVDVPQLDDDTAHLVRSTSPQHRIELLRHDRAQLPGFFYLDGRMMYAALTRELGVAPVTYLAGRDAQERSEADPYARARYLVRFRVPGDWSHVGLFMVKDDAGAWHAPREPRATGETWCDAAELHLARQQGWNVDVREALVFSKGRPLDTWTDRVRRARRFAGEVDAPQLVRDLARGALRNTLLHGIGAFHSTGREVTRVYASAMDAPAGAVPAGDLYVAREHAPLVGRNAQLRHPEWSSQVWGRAHARLLDSPTAVKGTRAGALHVPFTDVLGMRGDALYLACQPVWPDDGKEGRLRPKGALRERVAAPTTPAQLNELRARAERNGW
jgi:hypothetical protein